MLTNVVGSDEHYLQPKVHKLIENISSYLLQSFQFVFKFVQVVRFNRYNIFLPRDGVSILYQSITAQLPLRLRKYFRNSRVHFNNNKYDYQMDLLVFTLFSLFCCFLLVLLVLQMTDGEKTIRGK